LVLFNGKPSIRADTKKFLQVLRVLFPENSLDDFEKELFEELEEKASSLVNFKIKRYLLEASNAAPSIIELLKQSDLI